MPLDRTIMHSYLHLHNYRRVIPHSEDEPDFITNEFTMYTSLR
jgi:hypothetical protein